MLRVDPNYDFRRWDRWIRALIIDNYKYIWSSNGEDELYDLKRDPMEQKNLIEEEDEKAESMKERLSYVLDMLEYRDLGDLVQGLEDNIRIMRRFGYIRGIFPQKESIMQGLTP